MSIQEPKGKRQEKQEPEAQPRKVEPATDILFLCSYENCGKTFVDVAALRKHAHVHGKRGSMFFQEPGYWKMLLRNIERSYSVGLDISWVSTRARAAALISLFPSHITSDNAWPFFS